MASNQDIFPVTDEWTRITNNPATLISLQPQGGDIYLYVTNGTSSPALSVFGSILKDGEKLTAVALTALAAAVPGAGGARHVHVRKVYKRDTVKVFVDFANA